MKKIILLLLLLGGGYFFVSLAQTPQAFQRESEIIEYLEFREVDIKDALRQLAKQYNLNIVFSESVKGLITLRLHNVTVEEALDSIITINGFVYTKKGSVIKVTTPEEVKKESKQTRVFKLYNADASKLKETIKKVLSPEGTIEADERSNSLIITDNPAVISKIESMLPSLDEASKQVLIEARFIETSLGTTEKLGIDWTINAVAKASKRPTTFPFRKWGSDKDMYPVPSYTSEYDSTTGTWEITSDFPAGGEGYFFPTFPHRLGSFPMVGADEFTFGTLDFTQFQAVLDFLKTKTDSKLISSPRIVTMDNKRAEIYIGKARPIPTFEYNSETGEYQITGFEEKIEGVILTVTPQIKKVGDKYYIKLRLKPKVTTFSNETVSFTNLGFEYPLLSERYTDTEVMIEDNQTIVIGGLIETKRTETIHKVPFLGDLPLLGLLFRHKEINPDAKSELIIFVTARVVREDEGPLLAYKSNLITSPPHPFKLNLREITVK